MNKISKRIAKVAQPGDIINFEVNEFKNKGFFEKLLYNIVLGVIMQAQKSVFGKNAEWRDTHTMIYFSPEEVFSVEPPKPLFTTLDSFSHQNVSIYRYTKKKLTEQDVMSLRRGAEHIVQTSPSYDEGQLVDFLVEAIAGYPYRNKIKWFDEGSRRVVCSVGAASVYHQWIHRLNIKLKNPLPQPFKKLNPDAWSKRFLKRYEKEGGYWDLQRTYPACFANSMTHFDGEFEFVARIDGDSTELA